jgi:hypothetical protein
MIFPISVMQNTFMARFSSRFDVKNYCTWQERRENRIGSVPGQTRERQGKEIVLFFLFEINNAGYNTMRVEIL